MMLMTRKLEESEVAAALARLNEGLDPAWQLVNGKLHKRFRFADFISAFAFMTRVALAAEKMNHHPEWSNLYREVTIDLTTHEAGGISEKDFVLAGMVEELV
jgi:4a-hydroxytetrahydrobiopterin dehydratase